jgi:hypothetical protein
VPAQAAATLAPSLPTIPEWISESRPERKDQAHDQLTRGAKARAAAATQFTELQHDYLSIQTVFTKQLVKQAPHLLVSSFPERPFGGSPRPHTTLSSAATVRVDRTASGG